MPAPTRPTNFSTPFAISGTKNTIPSAPTGTNRASFTEGFPAVTMEPIANGGIPPSGNDFNGLFYDLFLHVVFINAGGQYQFDSALSTAMGGYPKGFVLQNNAGTASYISLVDSNTTDFNTTPSSIGTLWGAYSGAAFSNATVTTTGGTVAITSVQVLANLITVTGTLTSNAILTFPANLGEWQVVNSTVGNFSVTCVASGGTGVPIKQGAADAIYCDGTNISYQQSSTKTQVEKDASLSLANTLYADRGSSHVGGYSADTGTVNAIVIATTPATSAYTDGQTVRFRVSATNTDACTINAGAGVVPLIKGDGTAVRPGDLLSTAVTTATYLASAGKFIVNGLVIPDSTLNSITTINATQTLVKGQYNADTAAGSFACNLNATPLYGDVIRYFDGSGTFGINNFTLLATGGKSFIFKDGSTSTSLVNDVPGYDGIVWWNGNNWKVF